MKAQFVLENINFERGQDPKSSMGIGLSKTIYNRWDKLQQTPGIGSINIDKSLNGRFHLTIHVAQFPDGAREGFKRAKDIFGPLINDFYNNKGGEISIAIPQEFERAFIDAYNMRYPDWPINEAIEFNRTGEVLRDVGVGVKRNIPKYNEELANDIIEEFHGWGNGNEKLDELWSNLADDLEEYGYYTLEDYYGEDNKISEIENSIETYKWALTEFAKNYVWKPESIEKIVKVLFYYRANPADISFDYVANRIDQALKTNWGITESIGFERGGDPFDTLDIGKFRTIGDKVKNLDKEAAKRGFKRSELSENPYATDHPKFDNLLSWKDNKRNYILLYSLIDAGELNLRKYRVIAGHWPEDFKAPDNDTYPPGSYDDNLIHWIFYDDKESPNNPWERAFPDMNESLEFERGRDPKKIMGIGMEEQIKRAMEEEGFKYIEDEVALWWASEKNHPNFARYLLSKDIDQEALNKALQRAIAGSTFNRSPEIVEMLLEAGADPSSLSYIDFSNKVIGDQEDTQVLKLLIDHGLDVSEFNASSLAQRAAHKPVEFMKMLIDNGMNIEDVNLFHVNTSKKGGRYLLDQMSKLAAQKHPQ